MRFYPLFPYPLIFLTLPPFHKVHRQNNLLLRNLFLPQLCQNHLRRQSAFLLRILMNRRQPRNRQLRNIMIIKAHNRLIARHTYPPHSCSPDMMPAARISAEAKIPVISGRVLS